MSKTKLITADTPEELAEILGLPKEVAAEWAVKSQLIDRIIVSAKKSKLTHAKIAKKVGTSRTRITALLSRGRSDFSTDFLIRVLSSLGYSVDIRIKKRAS